MWWIGEVLGYFIGYYVWDKGYSDMEYVYDDVWRCDV